VILNSKINGVGVWFYSLKTGRHLYLMRNDKKYTGHWALPGGKIENDETLIEAITRECTEEMGVMPEYIKLIPVEKFTADRNYFSYHTFFCLLENEFIPDLNHEHTGYAWINSRTIPKPLHPGFWNTIKTKEIYKKLDTLVEIYTSH